MHRPLSPSSVPSHFPLQTASALFIARFLSLDRASLPCPLLAAQATVHCPLTLLIWRGLCFPIQTTPATCELAAALLSVMRHSFTTLATGTQLPRQCWPVQPHCVTLSFANYSDSCALPALLLAFARLSFPFANCPG